MARTPLARALQDATRIAAEASARQISVEQVQEERRTSRRRFLAEAGALGVAVTAGGRLVAPARAAAPARIVVVGGGLAGLTCAYRLKQAGLTAEVHEGAGRVGGRCSTLRGAFDEGQTVERCGELIDQSHTATRNIAQELRLDLVNVLAAERSGTETVYYFDGEHYTYEQATRDVKAAWQKIHKDVSAASYPTTWDGYTERGWELDHMSITDWIDETFEGGMASKIGRLLDIAYTIEYGGDSAEQSALNLLYLLAYSGQGQFRVFGPSNEKYRIAGGNDQLPQGLAATLAGQIHTGSELVAIARRGDGSYELTFRESLSTRTVTADRVVLALPFSILRTSVDYGSAGFEPRKQTAIQELGMGTNSKLHLQFRSRYWETVGSNGETFADTGYQNTWEVTRGQPGTAGILVNYTGGATGLGFGTGTPAEHAQRFLDQLEPVLPGIGAEWNGRVALSYPPGYRWTLGSYSYWKVGQYTRFAGFERERQGNCHFAGEHTSLDFQGYLNGAVESGERAAAEILADFK